MRKFKFDYLPLDKIDISPANVRHTRTEERLDELAKSIEEIGVQQPVVVLEKGDKYELIIGQRRYLACKKLNLSGIPALIATLDETQATIASFSENIQRIDLDYKDKMRVAMKLLEKLHSVKKIAKNLGVTEQTVRNYLGYAGVPETLREMVTKGLLSPSMALRIARNVPNEDLAVKVAGKMRRIPRGEDKWTLIEVAKENIDKPFVEITKIARRERHTKITIDVTQKIAEALDQACRDYKSTRKDITTEALEEWLKNRGFIK